MSTSTKIPLADAALIASQFRDLFDGCFARWEIAGSVRRKKVEAADVEHVAIAKMIDVPGDGLFAEPKRTNAILRRCDELVKDGTILKHIYANGLRWGEKYRGCDFKTRMQEIFLADEVNWGATLAIRTGSADFSRRLVTGLLRSGRRNHEGRVWRCEPCVAGDRCEKSCLKCQGTRLVPVEIIPVPDERTYFELCGVKYVEPEMRT